MRPEWSESDKDNETITLSEHNIALLTSSFSGTLPNSEWRKVRNSFPAPDVSQTRFPCLDSVFKTSTKPEVRSADSELARIQAFGLDPVGPLARVVHALDPESVEDMSAEDARSAAWDAIKLLGNTSGQISKLRQRKILKAVNPDMQDLADEDTFSEAAPDLFGQGFEAKMKGRAKSLKLISASSSSNPPPAPKKFFLRGPLLGPPERRRPSQPRGEDILVEERPIQDSSQEVAPLTVIGRDLPVHVIPCSLVASCQSLTSTLVKRGVVPLKGTSQVGAKVTGRLALFLDNWQKVTHDRWVLEIVQGYRLELLQEPVQSVCPRMLQTSPHEQSLLQEEILSMLQKGAITQLTPRDSTAGFYSSLFWYRVVVVHWCG